MLAENDNKIVLLICSSDNYRDAWEPCLRSLERWWADCPFEKVLLTESQTPPDNCRFGRVICINEKDWGMRLNKALDRISCDYVLFMLEDQWPVENVDRAQIQYVFELMRKNNEIAVFYLESDCKTNDSNILFHEIPFGESYRISAAPCIMRCEFLKAITADGYTPWDYERVGSFDKKGKDVKVLRLVKSAWKRYAEPGAILRGKWMPGVFDYLNSIGIAKVYGDRRQVSGWQMLKYRIKGMIYCINPSLIVSIQNKLYMIKHARNR